mgnify:CR=1 FL=1
MGYGPILQSPFKHDLKEMKAMKIDLNPCDAEFIGRFTKLKNKSQLIITQTVLFNNFAILNAWVGGGILLQSQYYTC